MALEDATIEDLSERCEECGVKLTSEEQRVALESGGPSLCAIHAAEAEPALAADEDSALE